MQYPKRSGLKDFGLIDLPFSLRKMALSPVGKLAARKNRSTGGTEYDLSRGVTAFPSVGDQVLIPTSEQIQAIVGAKASDRRVRIGASPLATNAAIMVDPDKIFGRHLAVLGNTGSGKSCSVAGLIRWSLEAATAAMPENSETSSPNARFIVLDPNGEYTRAFADMGDKIRLFRVPPVSGTENALRVPAWLWNGHEWTAVAYAKPGAQRPLLLQALRELKSGNTDAVPRSAIVRRYLVSYRTMIQAMFAKGTAEFAGEAPARRRCGELLDNIASDCADFQEGVDTDTQGQLENAHQAISGVANSRRSNNGWFNAFSVEDIESVRDALQEAIDAIPDVLTISPITELGHPMMECRLKTTLRA